MNSIQYIGYSAVHSQDFTYEYSQGNCHLFVLTATPAEFLIDGSFVQYPANSAILCAPGQKVCYRACQEKYQNDWIRFYSDESLVTHFPLTGIPFPVSDAEYCHHLIQLLTWESSFSSSDSDLIISHLIHALFLKLRQDVSNQQEISHAADLTSLRREIFNSPNRDWTLDEMADRMHLSTGYLQILYKKLFGITCMDDVIEGRIRMAKENLIYTQSSIQEIAELCGYRNVEHFCRQFKKCTGTTPGTFRKSAKHQKETKGLHLQTVVGKAAD